ncbi:MAG: hypothetical protein A2V86_08340 [Deltaproteobacteria bacterium RBG_16_49_23]|nr:MAG: hypothetical protein A2V86_08340 [Deltaproteobacteria bacterium RBG_16_49_23]
MKSYRWLSIIFIVILVFGCAKGGTYFVRIQYQPVKEFPSLSGKVGPTLGLVPFKDERPDQLYIGRHTPHDGPLSYFKSDPFPLNQAMMDSISNAFSRFGVKTLSVTAWDGQPESLKNIEADSVLMIEIKRFWTEGKAGAFRTTVKTSVHFVIHLGVKKEGKVFTKNVEMEKEATLARLTPERVETMANQALADIFNAFLSNPY